MCHCFSKLVIFFGPCAIVSQSWLIFWPMCHCLHVFTPWFSYLTQCGWILCKTLGKPPQLAFNMKKWTKWGCLNMGYSQGEHEDSSTGFGHFIFSDKPWYHLMKEMNPWIMSDMSLGILWDICEQRGLPHQFCQCLQLFDLFWAC